MKPEYATNDPKGWCGDITRGAAMGRPGVYEADYDAPVKLYLSRVHLNSGGYDTNGTYFGHGKPLYWYADENGQIDGMCRGYTRLEAKLYIQTLYSKATFYS